MPSGRRSFDVVIASDFRFAGGTSASLAQEIRAQAEAGYRTALVQIGSPMVGRPKPINARVQRCVHEGLAELVLPGVPLHARLLVMRHPTTFAQPPAMPVDVTSEHRVLVVNQAPRDDADGEQWYDPLVVEDVVTSTFGPGVRWVPIGPIVRDSLAPWAASLDLLDWDWHNVIDPDEWGGPREDVVGERPVIGRHSRPKPSKWPADAATVRAAYPDDPAVDVRVLGGADTPRELLGELPENWTVVPFNEVSPAEFLRTIDFFVYYHHPGLNEAFGRAMLEALAAGAVVILPPHFERVFGPAACYGPPEEVMPTVQRLWQDREAFRAQSAQGVAWVRDHFGLETHADRVATFIGEPASSDTAPQAPVLPRPSRPAPRVVFMTSNGGGLGHLTRTMAVARRLDPDLQALFFTLSTSYGLVREQGFPVEYAPSRDASGLDGADWARLLEERLYAVVRDHQPRVLVFDGTYPYTPLRRIREQFPDVWFVWSRRGMWREGVGEDNISRVAYFDRVIEPGELAEPFDRGLPATSGDPVPRDRVGPITLLDTAELVDREAAAATLGLDPDRLTVLVDVTDMDAGRLAATLDHVVARLLEIEDVQVLAPAARTSARHTLDDPRVQTTTRYPLSREFAALDFAVVSSGYNTYHELVRFGVPALFVPNTATALDDQDARARYAEHAGFGRGLDAFDPGAFDAALASFLDPEARAQMRRRGHDLDPGNGAGEAARLIGWLARRGPRWRERGNAAGEPLDSPTTPTPDVTSGDGEPAARGSVAHGETRERTA